MRVRLHACLTWWLDQDCLFGLRPLGWIKIKKLLRHKGFALKMMGCSPISDECVSEDEGLRNEILSKTHHSLNIVHPRCTKMYKDEERSRLEFSIYLLSSSL